MATEGTFILADIGGYTPFLTGVGIEHGKEITSDLFNGMLKVNRGRWKIANIEGDCIFFYREGREASDDLVAHVKALFAEFCERVIDIAASSACECGACTRVNQLTLKFIVHAGPFDTQKIGSRRELIGPDVVVAHRLLKNSVPLDEYVLLTRGYADAAAPPGLPEQEGCDDCEGIGLVQYISLDLAPVRDEVEARARFFLTADQARMSLTVDIDAPAEAVWQVITDREKRLQWSGHRQIVELPARHGRIGQVHRCTHSNGRQTVEVTTAIDDETRRWTMKAFVSRLMDDAYMTFEVAERPDGGSLCAFYMTFRERIPIISHIGCQLMMPMARRMIRKNLRGLKALCEAQPAGAT